MPPSMSISDCLRKLGGDVIMSDDEVADIILTIMRGEASELEIAAFLVGFSERRWTPTALASIARAMRSLSPDMTIENGCLDIVGTGGDGIDTFNVSTAASLVCAAVGLKVVKHGNRSNSSKCGSADLMEGVGAYLALSVAEAKALVDKHNFCFLFAQTVHPSMRVVAPVRKALKVRTVFNVLGPLTNPCRPRGQCTGVFAMHLAPLFVSALHLTGVRRVCVCRSEEGLDELSPEGTTHLWLSQVDGHTSTTTATDVTALASSLPAPLQLSVTHKDLGLPRYALSLVAGSVPAHNAGVLHALLAGHHWMLVDAADLPVALTPGAAADDSATPPDRDARGVIVDAPAPPASVAAELARAPGLRAIWLRPYEDFLVGNAALGLWSAGKGEHTRDMPLEATSVLTLAPMGSEQQILRDLRACVDMAREALRTGRVERLLAAYVADTRAFAEQVADAPLSVTSLPPPVAAPHPDVADINAASAGTALSTTTPALEAPATGFGLPPPPASAPTASPTPSCATLLANAGPPASILFQISDARLLDIAVQAQQIQPPMLLRSASTTRLRASARYTLPVSLISARKHADWLHGVALAPTHAVGGCSAPLLPPRLTLCAELKRASPSAGVISGLSHAQALRQAGAYMAAGAGVLSVLCEPRWFRGGVGDLRRIAMLRFLLSLQIRISSTAAEPAHPAAIFAAAWHALATSPLAALAAHYPDGAGDSPGFQDTPPAATAEWAAACAAAYPRMLPHVRAEIATVASAYLALSGDMSEAFPTSLPALLLKDFVVHPYQLVEARACHADTALLIVALFLDSDRYAVATQLLARQHNTLGPFSRTIDTLLTCACAPALRDSVSAVLVQENADLASLSTLLLSALALALALDLQPLAPPSPDGEDDDAMFEHTCSSSCGFPCSAALVAATSLPSSRLPLLAHRVRLIAALRPCWSGVAHLCLLLVWARVMGLEPLVEAANVRETVLAVLLGARALGINNRDLHTFTVDVNAAVHLGTVAWRTRLALPGVCVPAATAGLPAATAGLPEDAAGARAALPTMCVFALSGVRGRAEVLPMEQPLCTLWEGVPHLDAPPSLAEFLSDAAAVPDLPLALLRQLSTYAFPPLAVGDVLAMVRAARPPRPASALYLHADPMSGLSSPRSLVPPVPYVHDDRAQTGLIASVLVGEALMRAADPACVTAPDPNAVAVPASACVQEERTMTHAVRRAVADMLGVGAAHAPARAWSVPVRTAALQPNMPTINMHLPLPWRVLCKVCGVMDAAAARVASGGEVGSLPCSPSAGVSDLIGVICVPGKRYIPGSVRALVAASLLSGFNRSVPRACDELYAPPSSRFAWAMRLHEYLASSASAPPLHQWHASCASFPPLAALLCARLPLRPPGALPRIVAVCVTPTPLASPYSTCVAPAFATMQAVPLQLSCDSWLAPTHPLFPFCLMYIAGADPDHNASRVYVASPHIRARSLTLLHEYFCTSVAAGATTRPQVSLQLHGGEDVAVMVDVAVLTFISCADATGGVAALQRPRNLRAHSAYLDDIARVAPSPSHSHAFFAALPALVPVVGVCPEDSATMVTERLFARVSVSLDTILLRLAGEDSNPPVWAEHITGWPCFPLECDGNLSPQANADIFSSTAFLATALCSWWNHFRGVCGVEAGVGPGATVAPPIFSVRLPSEPSLVGLRLLCPNISAVLLDAQLPHAVGGTGARFEWTVLEQLRCALWGRISLIHLRPPLPVLMAGGLTPENVRDCRTQTICAGVDVSSGVDSRSVRYDNEHARREYYFHHGYLFPEDGTSTEFCVQLANSFNKDLSRVKAFVSNTQDN